MPDDATSEAPADTDATSAAAEADKAAAEAGVSVTLAASPLEARGASALFDVVWPRTDGGSAAMPELIRALTHAGNYVSIALHGSQVVGACLGFRGVDDAGPMLHSHLAGVLPGLQSRHVGLALKLHQRAWALEHGLDRVTWTFDPLVARNAYFNVSKLGGELTAFYVDFYGPLGDEVNRGGPSDRCLVTWRLRGRQLPAAWDDAPVMLASDGGRPVVYPRTDGRAVCCIPSDIVRLRTENPDLAAAWRAALREVFTEAFDAGLHVSAVSRDGRYLFEHP